MQSVTYPNESYLTPKIINQMFVAGSSNQAIKNSDLDDIWKSHISN